MTIRSTIFIVVKSARIGLMFTVLLSSLGCAGVSTSSTRLPSPEPESRLAPAVSREPATTTESTTSPAGAELRPADVIDVISGDTILVDADGVLFRVKYIGVDAPAVNHPSRGTEPYGVAALDRNQQIVGGRTVQVETDISQSDQLGRFLRYVYVDGEMVNTMLLREGLGRLAERAPDLSYETEFVNAQNEARDAKRGIWSAR